MIAYKLTQSDQGWWDLSRDGVVLFSQLDLAPAIKLARATARDEHRQSGRPTCVEMSGASSALSLGRYVSPDVSWNDVAAAR